MPLSSKQEELCRRLEMGRPEPSAAALIRQQARDIDELWDRLSRAYLAVRREIPVTSFGKKSSCFARSWNGSGQSRHVESRTVAIGSAARWRCSAAGTERFVLPWLVG